MKKPSQVNLKKSIRKDVLKRRSEIPVHKKRCKDSAIREKLLSLKEFKNAGKILFYASFKDEVETLNIIEEALNIGKRVMVPRVDVQGLAIHEIKGTTELSPGCMGIPEPPDSEETLRGINDTDLVIVPGVAFDTDGNRLGYGKGYYDKLLSKMTGDKNLVALAYEEQITEHIPSEPHDISINKIVTDERIIECHGHRKD